MNEVHCTPKQLARGLEDTSSSANQSRGLSRKWQSSSFTPADHKLIDLCPRLSTSIEIAAHFLLTDFFYTLSGGFLVFLKNSLTSTRYINILLIFYILFYIFVKGLIIKILRLKYSKIMEFF